MTGLQSVLQICICKATQIFRYRQAFSAIFQKCFFSRVIEMAAVMPLYMNVAFPGRFDINYVIFRKYLSFYHFLDKCLTANVIRNDTCYDRMIDFARKMAEKFANLPLF